MNIRNVLKSKKYLMRILKIVTISLVVTLIVFSFIVYNLIDKIIIENKYEANKKVLYQIEYNVKFMDDMIKNLCLSTYFNEKVQFLMYHIKADALELSTSINNINSYICANSFIHSIYVYNRNNDVYFSSDERILNNDLTLDKIRKKYEVIPKMKPIFRTIKIPEPISKDEHVFSYFVYDFIDKDNKMDPGIIINIKAEWLYNNIKMLNLIDYSKSNKVYILDNIGNIILGDTKDNGITKHLKNLVFDHNINQNDKLKHDNKVNIIKETIDDEKYLISYMKLQKQDWIILTIESYEEVFKYTEKIKVIVITITTLFLIIGFIISIIISKKIYRPIGNLMIQLKYNQLNQQDDNNAQDEITYIRELIEHKHKQLTMYEKEKKTNIEIIKIYYLRKFLLESYSFTQHEFIDFSQKYDISFLLNKKLVVCIFRADGNPESINKLKSSIINIIKDVFSTKFNNYEIIDIRKNGIAVILNVFNDENKFFNELTITIKGIQQLILNKLLLFICVSISDTITDFREFTKNYNIAINNMKYKYIHGKMCIIKSSMVKTNHRNSNIKPLYKYFNNLMCEIKASNIEEVQQIILNLLNDAANLNYNDIQLIIMNIINVIKNTVDEINEIEIKPIYINNEYLKKLYKAETIDEFYYNVIMIIKDICKQREKKVEDKYNFLVNKIKNIIDENFSDSSLCVKQIASIVKMSTVSIRKIFKDNVEISISNYITEIRLNKAVELLKNSSLSVEEIISKVGIESKSCFYRIFKKKFGTTPRAYILSVTIKEK